MRRSSALAAVLVATVLAAAATALPAVPTYSGTLKGTIAVKIAGLGKAGRKTKKLNNPGTVIAFDTTALSFTFDSDGEHFVSPMVLVKPGKYQIVPPGGPDEANLVAATQAYLGTQSGLAVHLTSVIVEGTHTVKKSGARLLTNIKLTLSGTTDSGGLPLSGTVRARMKGLATI